MSDTHGAESAEAETFDLTDVPMDGEDTGPADDGQDVDDDEAGGEPPERKAAADKAPLSAEEVNKRYENTRTALSEERRTRRALERRLEALERGERAPTAERPQRQAQAEPEADIDPEEDPIGALKQMTAKLKAYEQAEQQEHAQHGPGDRQVQRVGHERARQLAEQQDQQALDHRGSPASDGPTGGRPGTTPLPAASRCACRARWASAARPAAS